VSSAQYQAPQNPYTISDRAKGDRKLYGGPGGGVISYKAWS